MNANGGGTISDIIAGLNHVVAKCSAVGSLCVANVSLGGVGYNEIFNAAVSSAVSKGVVMVVAAGNSNEDACSYSPSSAVSAITVGSTTVGDEKSSFSNWGSCIDVYAPGSDITSSWNSSPTATITISGTSMATPRKSSHPRYLFFLPPMSFLLHGHQIITCCRR
jgi:subtilisin family serine protease